MNSDFTVVGFDAGSVSVSFVEITSEGRLLRSGSKVHGGHVARVMRELMGAEVRMPRYVALTGAVPSEFPADARVISQVALIRGVREERPGVRTLLYVGGEKFGTFGFDDQGEYLHSRGNSGCAAGTGSFLDQQAERLGLSDSAELARLAATHKGDTPAIAARCAVFAKTDLIHAQQEGWTLPAICDGLCSGLARTIADSLFSVPPPAPVLFAGGVALNESVVRHLERITGCRFETDADTALLYAALGAALELRDSLLSTDFSLPDPPVHTAVDVRSQSLYPPLELKLSHYPDFSGISSRIFDPPAEAGTGPVEVDIYADLEESLDAYLGIDVGSTSTKAALISPSREVLAGFYTRTAGRPVDALKALLAAVEDTARASGSELNIIGCATTGSGRKLAGIILKADTVLDEISAHARAAVEIDPAVDTIIEIGGQDAKFTTLKNGQVTSSIMNNVCAAGTGSFLEEQGQKLGIDVREYAGCTEGVAAPVSSDRCTVFMQRDLNHLLADGWTREEVLASALHAVRENYLQKVAVESRIGERIFFQGATAKIRTLVAAFEQKLKKPIVVSPWCHLTGALGAALELADRGVVSDSFRGTGLWHEEIPVRTEICGLCANHCKLTVATVAGETAACGFLCGRDYETRRFVRASGSSFRLLDARRRAEGPAPVPADPHSPVRIALPSALYMREDLLFWKSFFAELGIETIDGTGLEGTLAEGRRQSGADFCAPLTELHGQVHLLAERADYIFLPFYMETGRDRKDRRKYCYYSQFAPSMLAQQLPEGKLLNPVVYSNALPFKAQGELYKSLRLLPGRYPFLKVTMAWETAWAARREREAALRDLYRKERARRKDREAEDVQVMLLGRPYTVLNPSLNKGIPDIFANQGAAAFYQDMLPPDREASETLRSLLEQVHWHYASAILEAAESAARTPGLYPVLVSSFKCSPDSYIRTYFRQLMEAHCKPYLILELDEHGSSVGYETRIEAALRSFRNHRRSELSGSPAAADYSDLLPDLARSFRGKTILLPNWDPFTMPLIAANLRREGLDVRVLNETPESIRRSLRHNDGQCIPMNAVAEEAVEYVRRNSLDFKKTLLWMMRSDIACNITLYPHHIRTLFRSFGEGAGELSVFTGDISFGEVSVSAALNTYFAFLFGGLMKRIGCRLRPYEINPGETDRVIAEGMRKLEEAFLGVRRKEETVEEIICAVEKIRTVPGARPQVAIFGDIYVRDNEVFNNNLIRFIESQGGEVITTPYSQYSKMIADAYFRRWFSESRFSRLLAFRTLLSAVEHLEKSYYRSFERILPLSQERYDENPEEILAAFDMRIEHAGESMDNILKVWYIKRHFPDVSLFVQTSPGFCCAGLITEAMSARIEEVTGVPVVCLTYDGTGDDPNQTLVPYLRFPRCRTAAGEERKTG